MAKSRNINVRNKREFWDNVDRNGSCWEWQGCFHHTGYGMWFKDYTKTYAHRVAWQEANGASILPGYLIMHSCDNRKCCNPDHMSLGTTSDNIKDMHNKGRSHWQGVRNAKSKRN